MPKTTCHNCGAVVEGTLAELQAHVKGCVGPDRKPRKGQKKERPKRVILPPVGDMPDLPYAVEVPLPIKSQNKSQYAHWSTYREYKEGWYRVLPMLLLPIRGRVFPWSRWTFIRVYSGREREFDYGNLVGGAKPIPDALIIAGAIPDDTGKHFKAGYEQLKGERSHTIIRLEEVGDAPSH